MGTAEQAGPKSVTVVAGADPPAAGDDAAGWDEDDAAGLAGDDAEDADPDELQATALRARPAPSAETARR
ncbi:MAG TPA: hypothetical protein VKV38_07230 [Trebonia sp.]|nr:hypothetical protein [Trebonia sp.]